MLDHTERSTADQEEEEPLYLSDFVHTLQSYWRVIALVVLSTGVLYAIVAGVLFLRAPSQKLTMQPFRLDFERANIGEYPNGTRFRTSEIVNAPNLRQAFEQNEFSRFMPYPRFAESIFVLESNAAFERLALDYAARLSDPKLSPVDRERLQTEFEGKRQSLPKNEYTINFLRRRGDKPVPDTVVRKTLEDILQLWANRAVKEQHVLNYRTAVLSPGVVTRGTVDNPEPLVALQVLRSQILEVQKNITALERIPGAELVDTSDGVSLAEVRIRLDELVRYRLEPLVVTVRSSAVGNRQAALDFMAEQVAYDERELAAIDAYISGARDALTTYSGYLNEPSARIDEVPVRGSSPLQRGTGETVMPQISEGFLDRLLHLTKTIADADFRQKIIGDMRTAINKRIPLQQDLAYHQHVLEQLRSDGGNAPARDRASIDAEITRLCDDARKLVVAVNQIYTRVSTNLSPSTQLYTLTTPGLSRTERTASPFRVAAWGLVFLLIALVLSVVGALLHARIRREERLQSRAHA